jgi:DNA-binding MarR family transcriptional regulator
VRLAELAESEGVNPTMLSRMVADLVDAGLFERTSDPADRRAAWVGVTRAGADLAARTRSDRTAAVEAALADLESGEAARIVAAVPALEALAARLKAGAR